MRLLTYKDINFVQSDLLKRNNFIHAFFTKKYNNNEPNELQNKFKTMELFLFIIIDT